ncbi:MAG: hypothetical protein DCC68_07530 [Planctomycetota bacterium]|nr:MAG: hypothetical protein DCC68_07530 [Planctomycetota bacterium]
MMADAYVLSNADVRTLQRIAQRDRGDPVNHRPPVQGLSHSGRLPGVRIGVAYGTIPAAVYNSSGTLIKPGKGECKLRQVKADGTSILNLGDDLPIVCYNLVPHQIANGASILMLRDQTIEGDVKNKSEPGYLVFDFQENQTRRGYGIFRASGQTSGTQTGLINLTTTVTDSFNSNDLQPVIGFQVSAGAPTSFDRIVVNDPGIYRFTFDCRIRFVSPAEPAPPYSYQNKVAIVSGTNNPFTNVVSGTTNDLCAHRLHRRERFWLVKNQNFGTPATTDAIAEGEPWAVYECSELTWGDRHYSLPCLLDAGDTLSMWLDVGGRKGSYPVDWNAEFSVHFQSFEDDLSP